MGPYDSERYLPLMQTLVRLTIVDFKFGFVRSLKNERKNAGKLYSIIYNVKFICRYFHVANDFKNTFYFFRYLFFSVLICNNKFAFYILFLPAYM